jgi:hypothetical protein
MNELPPPPEGIVLAGRPTTSRRSSWRRHVIPTGSAASSISGSKTSTPSTPNGAPAVLIS